MKGSTVPWAVNGDDCCWPGVKVVVTENVPSPRIDGENPIGVDPASGRPEDSSSESAIGREARAAPDGRSKKSKSSSVKVNPSSKSMFACSVLVVPPLLPAPILSTFMSKPISYASPRFIKSLGSCVQVASIDPNGSKGEPRDGEADSVFDTKEGGSGTVTDSTLEVMGCVVAFPRAEGGEG